VKISAPHASQSGLGSPSRPDHASLFWIVKTI
jgi:hypothetical protein